MSSLNRRTGRDTESRALLIGAHGSGSKRRRYITYGMGVTIVLLLILCGLLSLSNIGLNIGILVEQDDHHTHSHGGSKCDDGNSCTEDRHQDRYCEYKTLEPGHKCNSVCCGELTANETDEGLHDYCAVVPHTWPPASECTCQHCAGHCFDFPGQGTDGLDCPNITINGTDATPGGHPDKDCDNNVCVYSIGIDTTSNPDYNDIDIPCHRDEQLYINACAAMLDESEDVVANNCLVVRPVCGELTFPNEEDEDDLGNSKLEGCAYYFACAVPTLKAVFVV